MAMNYIQLADEIALKMGYGYTSDQLIGWSHGIIEEIQINGYSVKQIPPTPATNGKVYGLDYNSMANRVINYCGYGHVSDILLKFCIGICNHILDKNNVIYDNPEISGKITSLNGVEMTQAVIDAGAFIYATTYLIQFCEAVCDHIMNNAFVDYNTDKIN